MLMYFFPFFLTQIVFKIFMELIVVTAGLLWILVWSLFIQLKRLNTDRNHWQLSEIVVWQWR